MANLVFENNLQRVLLWLFLVPEQKRGTFFFNLFFNPCPFLEQKFEPVDLHVLIK
jgi:hypothetical protein